MERYKSKYNEVHEFFEFEVVVDKEDIDLFKSLVEDKYGISWDQYGESEHFGDVIFEFTKSQFRILEKIVREFNKKSKNKVVIEKM